MPLPDPLAEPVRLVRSTTSPPPETSTPLFGRSEVLAEAAKLADGGFVVIVGAPGIGKTRLAIELCEVLASEVDDIAWVDLSDLGDGTFVMTRVARAIGLALTRPTAEEIAVAIRRRGRRCLVVLDDADDVSEEVTEVVDALSDVSVCSVVVTARETMSSPEVELRLSGLDGDAALELVHAVALEPLDEGSDESLRRLIGTMGGVPLAIRLAASRLDLMTPEQLADADVGAYVDGAELREAIRASWDRLSEDEQAVMHVLAVFDGGAEPRDVAAVADLPNRSALDTVRDLRGRSLIETRLVDDRRRLSLLPAIRAFTAERSSAIDLAMRDRHARHFASKARRMADEARTARDGSPLRNLERERDNLRGAAEWAIERGDFAVAEVLGVSLGLVARLSGVFDDFEGVGESLWSVRDEVGYEALEEYATMLVDSDRVTLGEEVFGYVADRGARVTEPRAVVCGRRGLARCAYRRGEVERSIELARSALTVAEEVGDSREVAITKRTLGAVSSVSGEADEAVSMLTAAGQTLRELGALRDAAVCDYLLGWHRGIQDDPRRQRVAASRAAETLRSVGDRRLWLEARWLCGVAEFELARLETARATFEETLEWSLEYAIDDSVRDTAEALVDVALEQGDLQASSRMLQMKEEYLAPDSHAAVRFVNDLQRARLLAHAGELDEARARLVDTMLDPPAHWNRDLVASAAGYAAALCWLTGQSAEAERILARAEEFVSEENRNWQHCREQATVARIAQVDAPESAGPILEPLVALRTEVDELPSPSPARLIGRLVESNLGRWSALFDVVRENSTDWLVSRDGVWFRTPDGEWVSLRSRTRLADLLACLARASVEGRAGLPTDEIVEFVWKGEVLTPDSALNRLRTTLSLLRKEGLGDAVKFDEGRYALDAERCVVYGDPTA